MTITVRHLGLCDYEPTWRRMRDFTAARTTDTVDEVWLLQHRPVFTVGVRDGGVGGHRRRGELLSVPTVCSDRGGRATYHAPGQVVAYLLLDLRRRRLGPKALVAALEQVVLELLADYGVAGERRAGMPGAYVGGAKIAALGLRVSRGCSSHGLALNVAMDLSPFAAIDPCGYPGLPVTQLADHADAAVGEVETQLARKLTAAFG